MDRDPHLGVPAWESTTPLHRADQASVEKKRGQLMIQDLEQIEYRRGMLESGMKPGDLPVKTWRGAKIPAEVWKSINEEDILNLGGTYGDKDAGDPVEYDHLRLVLTDNVVEIEVFNRGIALFTTDDKKIKRIHRVLCKLDDGKK
jgi:hypothetical protein